MGFKGYELLAAEDIGGWGWGKFPGVEVKYVTTEWINDPLTKVSGHWWKGLFAKANDLLRFFLVVIALGVLIYGGYLLISAKGDESKLRKAHILLLFASIGILVAVFSWAIVKLIVRFSG